jgi:excisionase family DNA binding protein
VTVAEEQESLSPREAADRLGFSRQHVVRLIQAGELAADKLPGSSYWQIPLSGVLAFEERREAARRRSDELSRSLDALGAPLE